jgi:hypothetical protein
MGCQFWNGPHRRAKNALAHIAATGTKSGYGLRQRQRWAENEAPAIMAPQSTQPDLTSEVEVRIEAI